MAEIGILTFLHNDNFGSTLQAYALQRALREMGLDAEHLDYRPDRTEKIRNLLRSRNHPKLILEGLRKKQVKAGEEGARQKNAAISGFYGRRMQMSPPCRNEKELQAAARDCRTLICGSDQIWNPVWLNRAYFLQFSKKNQQRLAYAASLGISTLPSRGKTDRIRAWVSGFDAVSVREEEGARVLEQICGFRPDVMPDPVCLLTREDWEELAEDPAGTGPFLLCYFIGNRPEYWSQVGKISESTGLPVKVVPVTADSYHSGWELLDGLTPEGFLGALRSSSLLLTDSFHGLALSTVLGKEAKVFRRYSDEDPESKNSRIDHFRREVAEEGLLAMRQEGLDWLKTHIRTA